MEESKRSQRILVGYDGSASADHALRWAIGEGKLRSLPVHVLHVVEWPQTIVPRDVPWLSEQQRDAALSDMRDAVAKAGGTDASVSIVEGSIVGTLCGL